MAKVIDLTERLNFNQRPVIRVRDMDLEINDSAETVLRIMGLQQQANAGEAEAIQEMLTLLLGEQGKEALFATGLSFRGLVAFVQAAIKLVTSDEGSDEGEAQTRTTV